MSLLLGLPLEIRQMIYSQLDLPSEVYCYIQKSEFSAPFRRPQYEWRRAADGKPPYGRESHLARCLHDVCKDMGSMEVYIDYTRTSGYRARPLRPGYRLLNQAKRKYREDSRGRESMLDDAWEAMHRLAETSAGARAFYSLLGVNRQIAQEVRDSLAREVEHHIQVYTDQMADFEHFPSLTRAAFAQLRRCSIFYDATTNEECESQDLIQRLAAFTKFMLHVKTLKIELKSCGPRAVEPDRELLSPAVFEQITSQCSQLTQFSIRSSQYGNHRWGWHAPWLILVNLAKRRNTVSGKICWVHTTTGKEFELSAT